MKKASTLILCGAVILSLAAAGYLAPGLSAGFLDRRLENSPEAVDIETVSLNFEGEADLRAKLELWGGREILYADYTDVETENSGESIAESVLEFFGGLFGGADPTVSIKPMKVVFQGGESTLAWDVSARGGEAGFVGGNLIVDDETAKIVRFELVFDPDGKEGGIGSFLDPEAHVKALEAHYQIEKLLLIGGQMYIPKPDGTYVSISLREDFTDFSVRYNY